MPGVVVGSRTRSRLLLWSLVGLIALATTITGLSYVSQRRGMEDLRQQFARRGFIVDVGAVQRGPFGTTLRHVKVGLKESPGVTATMDPADVKAAIDGTGAHQVTIGGIHLVLTGEPDALFRSLWAVTPWEGTTATWRQLSIEYSHRLFGTLVLEDVHIERADGRFVVRAGRVRLATALWRDVAFTIGKRNAMIEVGLGDAAGPTAPIQLGYFPSTGVAAQWTLTAAHQPARLFADRLGWQLGSAFDQTRVVGSLTFIVPDDKARPLRGKVQMVLDRWPRPPFTEPDALLGSTASFFAGIVPSDDRSRWDLNYAQVTLSLFSMMGAGRIQFGPKPSITLDTKGELTCAQLRAHLPGSTYLNQVKQFMEQAPASGRAAASPRTPHGGDRLPDPVRLRLQFAVGRSENSDRHVAWRLDPGCGLLALSTGSFVALDLPATR